MDRIEMVICDKAGSCGEAIKALPVPAPALSFPLRLLTISVHLITNWALHKFQ